MFRRLVALGLVAGFLAMPIGITHFGVHGSDVCFVSAAGGRATYIVPLGPFHPGDRHCLTCHWVRSLRASEVALPAVLEITTVSEIRLDPSNGATSSASSFVSTRAPPG